MIFDLDTLKLKYVIAKPLLDRTGLAAGKRALDSAPQGFQRGRLLDGSEIYRAFQRSSLSRWSASIAVPRSVAEQAVSPAQIHQRSW